MHSHRTSRRSLVRGAFISCCATAGLLVLGAAAGCQQKADDGPDYSRQLPPGESALRLVRDPARLPDIDGAYGRISANPAEFLSAIDQSARWFGAPSSRQFFPMRADASDITFEQARASVIAFRQLVETAPDASTFRGELLRLFDVYESIGYNNEGIVLFTGYYAPIFNASRRQSAQYSVPLYKRPDDLVTHEVTGEPQGRRTADGSIVPYHARREIDESRMFAGNELVWMEDELAAYIVHVNGSARLRMDDGSTLYIGYAGKTDRPYTGLGRSMVDEGLIEPDRLSLPAIKAHFKRDPQTVIRLINRNENYVFFKEYDPGNWPAGSLGVQVTRDASLATDKRIYPRGGVVLVDTEGVTLTAGKRRFLQFMLDQDTGGAIRAPGRADIFMGVGETAEILAGGQYAEGRLYYFFLKPQHISITTD